jgi:glycosyltransferase involved in cell wall biosynthesis
MNDGDGLTVFLVVGRLPHSLIRSKAEPLLASGKIDRLLIFSQERGFPIDGARYVELPKVWREISWKPLKKVCCLLYEPMQLFWYSMLMRPDFINGVGLKPKGLNSFVVSFLLRRKCILSVIGGPVEIPGYSRLAFLWKRWNLFMLRHCSVVTTTGKTVSGYLSRQGVNSGKIFEMAGSIDTAMFKPDRKQERDIDILFVGTFRRLKGPDRVLEVVARLKPVLNHVKACFLGDGKLFGDIRRRVTEMGLSDNVTLEGHKKQTVDYFQRARVLIMPSSSEGLSKAMLEAMACGCVPIVSNVGNMTDAAHHQKTAMVVDDYRDIVTFSRYALQLLTDTKLREEMAVKARRVVTRRYSIAVQGKICGEILEFGNRL